MKVKTVLVSLFLVTFLFVSCKKELQPQESSDTPITEAPAAPTQNIEKQFEVQNNNQQAPAPAQNVVQAPPVATAPGMNPPHGQPNHRCDIAVGAPLNSPKAAAPAPAKTPAPAPVQQAPQQGQATITPVDMASGTTATKPGMNPPHGQEGHRCEIAVGAPLPK